MKEKKITITLEDYSAAVDAVIEQMTLSMTSGLLRSVVSGIVSQVSRAIWDRLIEERDGEDAKRRVNAAMLRDFIDEHFASYSDFSERVGIWFPHLYYILDGLDEINEDVVKKFASVFREYGVDFEEYLMPLPLERGEKE